VKTDLLLTSVPLSTADLEGKSVVVIDVLRASTSICAALSAGAREVIATAGPGEAGEMRAKLGADLVVLAGERNGVRIENFHLGNSPLEFSPTTVGDKIVVMTTTNGTLALSRVGQGRTVYAGALVNVSRVASALAAAGRDIVLVCSGREGQFSIEDTLCGGMLVHKLSAEIGHDMALNDAASLALLLYRTNKSAIRQAVAQGEHARFLISIGFEADVEAATEVDSMSVLPVLRDGRLVPAEDRSADGR
jgi:2-phosphosulfolactate phosphatase